MARRTAAAAPAPDEAPRRLEMLPLAGLKAARRNPKDHDLGALGQSVEAHGFVEPLVLDERTGRLVAGHGRLEHLQQLQASGAPAPEGVETLPGNRWLVPVVRGWRSKDDHQAESYLLASNRVTELGGWKEPELAAMLKDLAAGDRLLGSGYDGDALDELLGLEARAAGNTQPDDAPDLPAAADTWVKLGDAFRLGDHRLVCGDARDAAVLDRLLGGELAQLCVTDPPWNVALDTEGRKGRKTKAEREIRNDALGRAFPDFCRAFVAQVHRVLEPGAALYLFMAAEEMGHLTETLRTQGFHWACTLYWVKDSFVLSPGDYHGQVEPFFYGWKQGRARLHPVADRTLSDRWDFPRPARSSVHPTMKPVDLVARAVQNSSARGHLVLDPFSGSGSVLMACEQTGRRARAVELEPRYVQATLQRWEDFTGRKAEPL